jgi:hypothetical protein
MSKYRIKGLPPIKLKDLLKKRGLSLKDFLKNVGIATYTTLVQHCQSMGVSCPTEEDFKEALGETVSSPQEGIVVLDPPSLIKDSGQRISIDEFSTVLADVSDKQEDVETQEQEEAVQADVSDKQEDVETQEQEEAVQAPVKASRRSTRKTVES